jgi:hypothetical protein
MRHRTRPPRPTSSATNKGANPMRTRRSILRFVQRRAALIDHAATVRPAIVPRWADDGALYLSQYCVDFKSLGCPASGPLLRI